jgi:Peptidase C13 family
MEQKAMSVRVRALLAAVLFLATACTTDSAGAPPPVARAPDVQLASVGASVPADRWRAVLIAGDNNSPAFDNGVEAMRDKLAERGVRDIRALTSDPVASPSLQVATAGNVSNALRNGGGEACLVFITSHGDESGVVLRAAKGMVEPATLGNALDAGCGSRPTVVIVSACHSGIFLTPAMRQPNRVVLTAAAANRVSFGCGAGDQYTYYDQCLLQQFDGAATWRALAAATRTCVESLERRMGVKPPSQPQIFVGAAVTDLRIPGR